MKKINLLAVLILIVCVSYKVNAQQKSAIVASPLNTVISADRITPTADGFMFEGHITERPAGPSELPDVADPNGPLETTSGCGLFGNWLCGIPDKVSGTTQNGDPWVAIYCVGTTHKCIKEAKGKGK